MKYLFDKLRFLPMMEGEGNGGSEGNNDDKGSNNSSGGTEPKTFTQEDLNRIAAQEKRQGMSSVLKALGFEKEEDAKAFVEKYKKEERDKKDDLTKAKEDLESEKTAKSQAEAKAELLERKFKVVSAGVSPDSAEDVVLLATAKAVDGKTFDDALEEVKKAYPMFFDGQGSEGSGGTGGNVNGARSRNKSGSKDSIGKRLAEQKKSSSEASKKQSYFSN